MAKKTKKFIVAGKNPYGSGNPGIHHCIKRRVQGNPSRPVKGKSDFLLIFLVFAAAESGYSNRNAVLVGAARSQIGKTVLYDASFRVLRYPNGDIPIDRGVCADVVIRALRSAIKKDIALGK